VEKAKYIITLELKNSPDFDTEAEARVAWENTHRTSSLWKVWRCDQLQKLRYDKIDFKVVYSDDQLITMHRNLLKAKYDNYKNSMTAPTLLRLEKIAKQKGINL